MTVEHSEQAKAAYPITDLYPEAVTLAMRTAFDRGIAERRITDRETLARTIFLSIAYESTPSMWEVFTSNGLAAIYYAAADAILALFSSTPTVAQVRGEALREAADEIRAVMTDPDRVRPRVPGGMLTDRLNDVSWAESIVRARADALDPKEEN